MSGEMNKTLPEGWRWVKLGEVCEFLDSKRIPVNNIERQKRIYGKSQSELYPYYGANGIVGYIDDYIFDEPLILLAEDGGFFGSHERPIAYKIDGKSWVNNHAHVLRPIIDTTDIDFLLYSIIIRPDIIDLVAGNTRLKLNQEVASEISIPLPPLPEQKRIAAILNEQMDAVEKARAAAEAQLEAAKALPAAYLREVFPGPGEELPEGWRWVKLGEVLIETRNGIYKPDEFYGKGIPILKMFNIGRLNGEWMLNRVDYINLSDNELSLYRLDIDDILLNRVNSRELVGKCAVITSELSGSVFESKNMRLRVNKSICIPHYIVKYINSIFGRIQIYDMLKQIVGQATINRTDLDNIQIPLPPLPEQKRISAHLNEKMFQAEKLRTAIEGQLKEINSLPASILRKAFSGGF